MLGVSKWSIGRRREVRGKKSVGWVVPTKCGLIHARIDRTPRTRPCDSKIDLAFVAAIGGHSPPYKIVAACGLVSMLFEDLLEL